MKRQILYVAIPLVISFVLILAQDAIPSPPPAAVMDGKVLYGRMCALCHGDNGEGYAAPASTALSNPSFLAIADDDYVFENTARGRPGTRMSAWAERYGGPLSESQVWAIVGYIRGWQTVPVVDVSGVTVRGDPVRGARVYAEGCAQCHGATGGGLDHAEMAPSGAPSLSNPVFLDTASDGFIRYSIAQGRPGTPMPAYADELTAQQIDDLVALIRSWGQ